MRINFTVTYVCDVPNEAMSARVTAVETEEGRLITEQFTDFCDKESLPLSTEDEISAAAFEYGKRFSS